MWLALLLALLIWRIHDEISAWRMNNLKLSRVLSVPSGEEWNGLSNQAKTASLHNYPNHSDTKRYIVWYTNSAVK
jgi:hypothetical protein